jgi:hypothetical protein
MRYAFHGGGHCDGALNGAVMPGPLAPGAGADPASSFPATAAQSADGSPSASPRAFRVSGGLAVIFRGPLRPGIWRAGSRDLRGSSR